MAAVNPSLALGLPLKPKLSGGDAGAAAVI
jgi:hypothetical protein